MFWKETALLNPSRCSLTDRALPNAAEQCRAVPSKFAKSCNVLFSLEQAHAELPVSSLPHCISANTPRPVYFTQFRVVVQIKSNTRKEFEGARPEFSWRLHGDLITPGVSSELDLLQVSQSLDKPEVNPALIARAWSPYHQA
ncbi:hypothetical protein PoB_002691100 [Plakobranchus ocellatus]|uniref:Uncharacterized protein n=1 Tax=Plakobranchus ocellatus TaxID=259542 RepID=A0AAV4A0X7_9GAST|nr:hypothetical protein PoB_002691100 [Plakobranchus ocellatus]